MARRCCYLRSILICVCTPCCCLILLYSYAIVTIYLHMNSVMGHIPSVSSILARPHFVATGASSNGCSPYVPKTFWEQYLQSDALWNQLQRHIDRRFNPIIRKKKSDMLLERSSFDESLLHQSYFEVTSMNRVRENFDRLPKQVQDFASNMHKRNYPILIRPDGKCGAQSKQEKEPPLILFAIKSSALNFRNRQVIRQTWGRIGWVEGQGFNSNNTDMGGGYIRRVFLLGKETSEDLGVNISPLLRTENKHHGDILQWDFKDTFFNLTLKDVLFWSWFSRHCGKPLFVLKGDDDVFVNTPKLISYLRDQLEKHRSRNTLHEFMVGEVIGSASPNRVRTSKYFIPEDFYKGLYPMYAGGGGVVYSAELTRRLHNISKTVHLFPIDDVYVGMCMIRLNAHPVHHPAFLTFDFTEKEKAQPCSYHTILLVHKRSPRELIDLWANLKDTRKQCQGVPLREVKK